MKISVFYEHLQEIAASRSLTMPQVLAEVKNCGIDAAEMPFDLLEQEEKTILPELEKAGLQVSSLHANYDWGNDPDIRRGRRQIEAAVRAGAQKILVIPGFVSEKEADGLAAQNGSPEQEAAAMEASAKIRNMRTALRQMIAYGQSRGIAVTLEDFDGRTAPYARANQLLWFMRQAEGLRFTLDTGNFAFSDEDALNGFRLLRPYVVHVHCKDRAPEKEKTAGRGKYNRGLAPCPVGGGYMPIKAIVQELKADGYGGFLTIEHFGAADQLTYIKQSAAFLQALCR